MEPIVALDLFAGTGWGVACQWLGIDEMGVENMAEAVATRQANGMKTIYRDVWYGLEYGHQPPPYNVLIASPPCQTFSMAGKGAGRRALDEVLQAIDEHAYKDPAALRAFGAAHDMRTALVLAPLAHVYRDRPRMVVFEQVPTVLPVWEACAEVMREWGYDVKVAVLNAEQYGVPQTRRRAILVAKFAAPVSLPVPTHSKYYSANPSRLDPGVLPWVSMAEALGWEPDALVGFPRLSDGQEETVINGVAYRARDLRPASSPSQTVTEKTRSWRAFTQNNKLAHQAVRSLDQPAPTITAGHDSGNRGFLDGEGGFLIATPDEVAALQSYPSDVVFRNGNQAHSAVREPGQPAPTIHFGARSNKVEWLDREAAADPSASGQRVSVDEASVLQSYRPPFAWCGSKTKVFLQIGNAVPPVLGAAILSALIAD
jgi:DNA (cytosine-5)-methyltransferase 1